MTSGDDKIRESTEDEAQRSGTTRRSLLTQGAVTAAGITLLGVFGTPRRAWAKDESCGTAIPGSGERVENDSDCGESIGAEDTDRDNSCGKRTEMSLYLSKDEDCGKPSADPGGTHHTDARCGGVYKSDMVFEDMAFKYPGWDKEPYPGYPGGSYPGGSGPQGDEAPTEPRGPVTDWDESCGKRTNWHFRDRDGMCGRRSEGAQDFLHAADFSCGVPTGTGESVYADWNCGNALFGGDTSIKDQDGSCGQDVAGSVSVDPDGSCGKKVLSGSQEGSRDTQYDPDMPTETDENDAAK